MAGSKGVERPCFYFEVCGEANTGQVISLSIARAQALGAKTLLVASETGLSALRALESLRSGNCEGMRLVVATSALGTQVHGTVLGDLNIGIPDPVIWNQLKEQGAEIVRATDPLYNLDAPNGLYAGTGGAYRAALRCFSGGTAVCLGCTAMATDAGLVSPGELVVAMAGSWVGLDTALVTRGVNAVNLLRRGVVLEMVCKPWDSRYTWPINQRDWQGDLEPYRRFAVSKG